MHIWSLTENTTICCIKEEFLTNSHFFSKFVVLFRDFLSYLIRNMHYFIILRLNLSIHAELRYYFKATFWFFVFVSVRTLGHLYHVIAAPCVRYWPDPRDRSSGSRYIGMFYFPRLFLRIYCIHKIKYCLHVKRDVYLFTSSN